MLKLNLKFVSFKNDADYYFKVNNPEVLTDKYEGYDSGDKYYPFFKGDKGQMLLKIKDKYIDELDIIKDAPFDAKIHLNDFRLKDRTSKKIVTGLYVDRVVI